MGKTRKIVGVSLAVGLALALVAYVFVPHTGPSNETVGTNQPQQPQQPAAGTGDTNGGSSGTSTPPPTPDVRPPKLHGKNSQGPKHVVCLPVNEHVQGVAQYQGANWYRGECAQGAGANSQGSANGQTSLSGPALVLRHVRVAAGR